MVAMSQVVAMHLGLDSIVGRANSFDIMKRIWRKGINKPMISGLLSK